MFRVEGPSPEEQTEKIKFEINQLFDSLEINITDPNLKNIYDFENKFIRNLLDQKGAQEELPQDVKNELYVYFRLLETIRNDSNGPIESSAASIKIAVAHAKIYYDLGKTSIALDLLDDPEVPEGGAVSLAENCSNWSEELKLLYENIRRLANLIYALRFDEKYGLKKSPE